jgi:hypothetical protein
VNKKSIGPLPPIGSFPGYNRGAAVFNTWVSALLQQTTIWNNVWSKMKEGSLNADQGVQAFVQSVESSVKSVEGMFEAAMVGSAPEASTTQPEPGGAAAATPLRKRPTKRSGRK